jgi:hypothetical protein
MSENCRLREASDLPASLCDEGACVFWRAVDHLGEQDGEGCAIEHYKLLGDKGLTDWLMSVKHRIEQKAQIRP